MRASAAEPTAGGRPTSWHHPGAGLVTYAAGPPAGSHRPESGSRAPTARCACALHQAGVEQDLEVACHRAQPLPGQRHELGGAFGVSSSTKMLARAGPSNAPSTPEDASTTASQCGMAHATRPGRSARWLRTRASSTRAQMTAALTATTPRWASASASPSRHRPGPRDLNDLASYVPVAFCPVQRKVARAQPSELGFTS
jgi:hypothetical protein